jgi:hypothetical protein
MSQMNPMGGPQPMDVAKQMMAEKALFEERRWK